MDKDTSEIAKLTERISKDPKSKLFVPLAEEYKKAGDREMSIHVLTEGLKNNPGYVTARSLLGKLLFEKGDLSGAQKEFEEVVKAIPDNLMAQRKLGDLYVLQDRQADALKHYKIALSLNPRDPEIALLVSEAEAGRDIKARIPKPIPVAVEDGAKQPDVPKEIHAAQAATKSPPHSVVKRQLGPVLTSVPPEEEEVPEEVLVVEPLEAADSVSLEQALATENLGFLSEAASEPLRQSPIEEENPVFFDQAESVVGPGTVAPGGDAALAEALAFPGGEPGEAEFVASGKPEKAADDFTTNTLAELYISQGFYEKAVDIYERMLVDNPNSQGLKDKLATVRAMAAQAAPEAEPGTGAGFFPGSEDSEIKRSPGEAPLDAAPGIFDAFVPPEPAETQGSTAPAAEQAAQKSRSRSEPGAPEQPDNGFAPVEYVPPADETATRGRENAVIPPPRKTPSGRKETIDRLENWLQHIMKEK